MAEETQRFYYVSIKNTDLDQYVVNTRLWT